jgi:hypothetical protein
LPVLSTAAATTWSILKGLGLEPRVEGRALLAGVDPAASHR